MTIQLKYEASLQPRNFPLLRKIFGVTVEAGSRLPSEIYILSLTVTGF